MAQTIGQIPYFEATFDKNGVLLAPVTLPDGLTDLFVISHGWRNDAQDARTLYQTLFSHFADPTVNPPDALAGRQCAIVGIFWPSQNFDLLMAGQATGSGANTAAIGDVQSDPGSQGKLVAQLEKMKSGVLFSDPAQQTALARAQTLVPDLDDKSSARQAFVDCLRSLADRNAADKEDASDIFFKINADDLFHRLNIPANVVDPQIPRQGSAMALSPDGPPVAATGHAAGFLDVLQGAAAAGTNAASYLSYYIMKERAGVIGVQGVAPLLDSLADKVERIHLLGHSFGGRVVAATALAAKTDKLHTMGLLQAAFSHNGFSPATLMNGYFRPVLDSQRINGTIFATYTKNDTAVGIAYPLASRLSGTVACALGDENDKYGGMGRNGAQQMNDGERVLANLLEVGGQYAFSPNQIVNLEATPFIKSHGDVTGPQVAAAIIQAVK